MYPSWYEFVLGLTLDLALADPRWLPHPVRWMGWMIVLLERGLYDLFGTPGWRIVRRDGPRQPSPNAGFPEAAVAGVLGVQLGGANRYSGCVVEKPFIGDTVNELSTEQYQILRRILYLSGLAVCADAARVREMLAMRQPWQVNQLAQLAGEICPTLSGYQAKTLELIRQERAWLKHQLAAITGLVSYPGAANFLLGRLDPTIGTVLELHNRLLQHRILIRRCDGWPGLPDNCFRIAVRSRKENELLIERLKKCL